MTPDNSSVSIPGLKTVVDFNEKQAFCLNFGMFPSLSI